MCRRNGELEFIDGVGLQEAFPRAGLASAVFSQDTDFVYLRIPVLSLIRPRWSLRRTGDRQSHTERSGVDRSVQRGRHVHQPETGSHDPFLFTTASPRPSEAASDHPGVGWPQGAGNLGHLRLQGRGIVVFCSRNRLNFGAGCSVFAHQSRAWVRGRSHKLGLRLS